MQSKTHRSKFKNLVDEKVVYTEKDTISFSQTIKNAEHKLIIKRKSITQKEREKEGRGNEGMRKEKFRISLLVNDRTQPCANPNRWSKTNF